MPMETLEQHGTHKNTDVDIFLQIHATINREWAHLHSTAAAL